MADMVKAGIVLNVVGIILTTTLLYLLGLFVFEIDPGLIPDWAH